GGKPRLPALDRRFPRHAGKKAAHSKRENQVKTSLVAGGSGFIGSHLCEALLTRGHKVVAVDSLISGRRSNLKSPVFEKYRKNFKFLKKDILRPLNLKADFIFNLASPASPPHYQTHSIYTLRTGSEG